VKRDVRRSSRGIWLGLLLASILLSWGCSGEGEAPAVKKDVPRGYVQRLEISTKDGILSFGPFVGYYFKPYDPDDLTRLQLICFNERRFYTRDLPENAQLFTGEAVFATLPDMGEAFPSGQGRIRPVFFDEAPEAWTASRPEPRDQFVHFHSCRQDTGPVHSGYWIRHEGVASFTYDMGGRVGKESPLYHRVTPGPDRAFPKIIEFDWGPSS
jgi:hypothetical protein